MQEQQEMITEKMVETYFQLSKKAKEIERELSNLKKRFNQYFDSTVGENRKGEIVFNHYILHRQIRVLEKYQEEEAIAKLEEKNLTDFIKVVKQVDTDKIKAAIELGLVDADFLSPYKKKKYSAAFHVKER
ncbi:hypothetical protein [Fervidibacillus halotolerans]|uniref:Uncharacterized protein n=1 Tax=Fervidibacillus halotolerans TaxID=2980027 RepID=A0A9E8S0N0_9BACI|nr:hypothetical protein [Fervidibacillus halotolerans]WAA12737.1 hypothetical protein OE105_00905 [Fervidibacillus halotolerans]